MFLKFGFLYYIRIFKCNGMVCSICTLLQTFLVCTKGQRSKLYYWCWDVLLFILLFNVPSKLGMYAAMQTNGSSQIEGKSVKLSEIFSYGANWFVCKICSNAKIQGEFSTRKTWTEWKLDYLKRHLTQKCQWCCESFV